MKVGYRGAIRHSGDILFRGDCKGEHTIDADLTCLAPVVREMYITISAFNEPPSFLSVSCSASLQALQAFTCNCNTH